MTLLGEKTESNSDKTRTGMHHQLRRTHLHVNTRKAEIQRPIVANSLRLASTDKKIDSKSDAGMPEGESEIEKTLKEIKDRIEKEEKVADMAARVLEFKTYKFTEGFFHKMYGIIKIEPQLNKSGNLRGMVKTGMAKFTPWFRGFENGARYLGRFTKVLDYAETAAHYWPNVQQVYNSNLPDADKITKYASIYESAFIRTVANTIVTPFKLGASGTQYIFGKLHPEVDCSNTDQALAQLDVKINAISDPDNVERFIYTQVDIAMGWYYDKR